MRGSPPSKPSAERPGPADEAAGAATPLKPRRGLLKGLGIAYALWLAALLALYFATVYPRTHPAAAQSTPAAP